jgi:hypothetical protein
MKVQWQVSTGRISCPLKAPFGSFPPRGKQVATWVGLPHSEAVLAAANHWRERCLLENRSVFTDNALWTPDRFATLRKLFVENPILGEGRFFDKLQQQIGHAEPVITQLAAEMIWLLLLRRVWTRYKVADKIPQKHEVTSALKHLSTISATAGSDKGIDWDESKRMLHLADPYLRFYLRWQVRQTKNDENLLPLV